MFKLGDVVTWKSQANGSWKEKNGTVAEVVPAGQLPSRERFPKLYKSGIGSARSHESYVVEVYENPEKKTGHAFYWPIVSKLTSVTPES